MYKKNIAQNNHNNKVIEFPKKMSKDREVATFWNNLVFIVGEKNAVMLIAKYKHHGFLNVVDIYCQAEKNVKNVNNLSNVISVNLNVNKIADNIVFRIEKYFKDSYMKGILLKLASQTADRIIEREGAWS